jgi:hypothetical protein
LAYSPFELGECARKQKRAAKLRRADLGWVRHFGVSLSASGGGMLRIYGRGLALVVLWCLAPAAANAGPPYRTDDPEPTPLGHYEFYTFSTGTVVRDDTSGSLPAFELNYGLIPNGQLTIDASAAFDRPSSGPLQYGYGDTPISFKYRFIQEDEQGWRPQVAVFPLVQLPTGDESRGLGAGHVLAFLPMWFQKSFGDWTIDGGGGYWINRGGAGDKNFWFSGLLLQRKVTDKLSVGGEIFHQTADAIDSHDSTGFNFGAIYDFNEHDHFVFSAGRGLQNADTTNDFSWYAGFLLTGP